jgi:hypothetical protein
MSQNDEERAARINELRSKNTDLNRAAIAHNAEPLGEKIDNLIHVLQENKGHIGAIGIVVLPTEGDSLVDMDAGRACDGIACIMAENEPGYVVLEHHWKSAVKQQHDRATQRSSGVPASLAALLGGLSMGREEPSDGDDE